MRIFRLVAVVVAASFPVASHAQQIADRRDTLTLDDAIAAARAQNPSLRAVQLRAAAADERIAPAGALPDPQLSFALMNRPIDGFGTGVAMTMNQVQLQQRFPWPGKLRYNQERIRLLAVADGLEAEEAVGVLGAKVTSRYVQLAFLDRALVVMSNTRGLLRNFLEISRVSYSVGTGLQQDVLQAQVAVAQMTEDITVMEQHRIAAAARLNALMGRSATDVVGAVELPQIASVIPEADSLIKVADSRRPALLAAQERVSAAEAGYQAVRRTIYPDVMLTLGYAQRPQFADLATIGVGFSVPLFAGKRQLPMRREMQAMQAMEEARAAGLHDETYAALVELVAEANRARRLADLYATSIVPQARAAVEASLSAYRVGRTEYTTLVQSQMTVNRYEIEAVRLTADFHRAVSEIESLIAGHIGEDQ